MANPGSAYEAAAGYQHLRAAVELSSDALIALDADGLLLAVNGVARRLLGRYTPLPIGTDLDAFVVYPVEWRALLRRVLAGEIVHGTRIELPGVGGRTTSVAVSAVALRDDDGRIVGCTVALRDLTEQLFAQRTLAENERRVRRAEALALTGSFVIDGQHHTGQWSEGMYRVHGNRPEDFSVTLESQLGLVHEADRDAVAEMFQRALVGQHPAGIDHRVCRADGVLGWVFTAAEPVVDTDRRVLGISGVCQEITARMASEAALHEALLREQAVSDELRRLDRLKDEFLATVSHELRTPLTSILGFAALLAEMAPERAEIVQRIERNAREMHRLTQGLLDQARLDSGRVVLEQRRVLLADAVRRVCSQHESVLRGVTVTTTFDETWTVDIDAQAFERILGNVLDNAAKYAPGEPIEISATRGVGEVTVAVTDRGPGIAEEHQTILFDPYFRVPGTDEPRGSGFGLAIVRRYVELHGGRVWCRSAPGRGSTFLFTLPDRDEAGQ